jgi:hypothetical protein
MGLQPQLVVSSSHHQHVDYSVHLKNGIIVTAFMQACNPQRDCIKQPLRYYQNKNIKSEILLGKKFMKVSSTTPLTNKVFFFRQV